MFMKENGMKIVGRELLKWVVGFAVSLITGVGAAMLTIVFLFLMPAFLCVGLMALALARLIHRAALLREDNELTV